MPECKAFCDPAEVNGVTLTSNCKLPDDSDDLISCPKRVPRGTTASIACKHGYERSRQTPHEVTCGPTGRWVPDPLPCQQVCGEIYSEARPLIVGGTRINVTRTPWHAGVYKKKQSLFNQICGASIINARVVISAMHCFWNAEANAPFDYSDYSIAVGKTRRDYLAAEDVGLQQNFHIESLHYVDGYSHADTNYADDIVVVVLQQPLEFKPHISPVCVPYDLRYDDRTVPSGLRMKVAGWGLERPDGDPSLNLKVIELSSVSRRDCAEKLIERKINFVVSSDKFCAGFEAGDQNVCGGDSGGGLVLSEPAMGKQRTEINFLRGIVSTAISNDGTCDVGQYSQFTNIAFYLELIGHYDRLHRPENNFLPSNAISNDDVADRIEQAGTNSTHCVVSEIPSNGRAQEAFNTSWTFAVGDVTPLLTVLRYKCDENYILVGKELNYCVNGRWVDSVPQCEIIDPGEI